MKPTIVLLLLASIAVACTPQPAPGPEFPPDVEAALVTAFPEDGLHATARCIVRKESGGNRYATNGQYRGLAQLGSNYNGSISVTNDGDVFTALTNLLVARQIFDARGNWSAWAVAGACGVR